GGSAVPQFALIVIPAKAGIHQSASETAEPWVPACAGTTIWEAPRVVSEPLAKPPPCDSTCTKSALGCGETQPHGRPGMRTSFTVGDMTIHRIVEQEQGFTPMLEFLPTLSQETLEENLSWLAPGGYSRDSGNVVL